MKLTTLSTSEADFFMTIGFCKNGSKREGSLDEAITPIDDDLDVILIFLLMPVVKSFLSNTTLVYCE